jgi:hypothetical protein
MPAEASQQVSACGVVVAVVVEPEEVEHGECCLGASEFGYGDGAVHGHDRRVGEVLEPLVEEGDLLPVAWFLQVLVGDGCLDGVGPASLEGESTS